VSCVVEFPKFSVYVYSERGAPHHLPHCEVRWNDGTSAVVRLPSLQLLAGRQLSRADRKLLASVLDALAARWNELNG